MKRIIYADNAATTPLDRDAFEAMKPYLLNEYGNASQPYSFSRGPKRAIKEARAVIAQCINAEPEEIYFTSGGSESDNWALKGNMYVYGDHQTLITSQIEHHAILHAAESIKKMGHPVAYLPVTTDGVVLPETLSQYITSQTKLVSIMFANNEIGTIEPIKLLSQIAHENGALFHTDAVQAVGHVKIDVKELGVDMLSASAHKFNGPKGIGFLYIKKGTPINAYIDGGAQESGMRAGTENVASIVGMATALLKNCQNIRQNYIHIENLEQTLLNLLYSSQLDFIRNGSKHHIPGNMSLSFKDAYGETLLHRLDLMGISISTGSACDSVNTQVSHVLKAIKTDEKYAKGTIRISLGKDNTEDDCITIANALKKILM